MESILFCFSGPVYIPLFCNVFFVALVNTSYVPFFLTIMYFHVYLKFIRCHKNFVTNTALIWIVPCVCSHKFQKLTFSGEFILTKRTLICFPSVCYHMSCKLIFSVEFVLTKITLIWCFPSVCYHMSCELIFSGEFVFTKSTLIWFSPSVLSYVFQDQ